MNGRPTPAIADRDIKPEKLVEVVRTRRKQPARRARLVVLLRRILDNHSNPDEGEMKCR